VVTLGVGCCPLFFSKRAFRSDKLSSAGSLGIGRGESNVAALFNTETAGPLSLIDDGALGFCGDGLEFAIGRRLFDFDVGFTLDNLDDTTSAVLSDELRLGFAGLDFRAE
jgi:hypothetical protein